MRVLGDQYVRDEFKRHKSAAPKFVPLFLREWEQYEAVMRQKSDRFGEELSADDKKLLDDEQQIKLRSLQDAAKKVGETIAPAAEASSLVAAIAQVETASLTSRGSARFSDGCDDLFSRAPEGVHHDLAVAVQPLQSSEFSSASSTVLPPSSSPLQMNAPTPEAYPGRLASRNEDQLAILRDMLDSDTNEHNCEPAGNSADTVSSRQLGSRRRYLAVVLRSALTVRTHTQTASKPPARSGGFQLVFKGIWVH
ncbi:unnamed protein product [Phytophthora lilii]|uniref:Succinate dehydrogenase assembly factor 3 n=1 Tax=Phytophthora lilii TaxID=2077276 RepID=A0A9W6WY74_9STRA|nr:unnamed protein product [Phytophthora lilii]